jgi:hypothetical protein
MGVTSLEPEAIEEQLLEALTGEEPPADLLERLGGWFAIEMLAPRLTNSPLMTPVLALVGRDITASDREVGEVRAAVAALVEAVTASTDPLQFAQGLEEFCGNQFLLAVGGADLASRCLTLAQPPQPEEGETVPSPAQVLRHAEALETYARLTIAGQASKYKLFSLLEDISENVRLYGRRSQMESLHCRQR